MKAYIAGFDWEEWMMLVHGETRGKAKWNFVKWNPSSDYDPSMWNDIRLHRLPGCDNLPFTYENAKAAGFVYLDDWDGEELEPQEFTNDCQCEICKV